MTTPIDPQAPPAAKVIETDLEADIVVVGAEALEEEKQEEEEEEVAVTRAASPVASTTVKASNKNDPLAWVTSDDPESIREHTQTATPDSAPKVGVGCWNGCWRDGHFRHLIVYVAMIIYTIVWIIKRQSEEVQACLNGTEPFRYYCGFWSSAGPIIVFLVIYILFLVEFCCSSTNKYLRHTESIPDALAYLDKLYRTKPSLSLSMECYHYRTRIVRDSKGRTTTKREKVTTWTGSERVHIVNWYDVTSRRLDTSRLSEFQMTKVKLFSSFTADANYEQQKSAFVNRNRHRDTHYNLYVHYDLNGFRPRIMTFVKYEAIPWLVGWDILLLCH